MGTDSRLARERQCKLGWLVSAWSALAGLVGATALWGVYRALEVRWPDAYSSLNDTFGLSVAQHWWRLLAYRVVPVFVIGLATLVTTNRLSLDGVLALWVALAVHAVATNGRALTESLLHRNGGRTFQINHATYHFSAIALLGITGVGVLLSGRFLSQVVPQPRVLLENLWVALFIAVAGGVLYSFVRKRDERSPASQEEYYVWRAERDVGIDLIDASFSIATQAGADPLLLRSLMYAEVLQRPKWVRRLERAAGAVLREGTYGVTQQRSPKPLSDLESLELSAAQIAGQSGVARSEWGWNVADAAIWRAVAPHNGDLAFIDAVQRLYAWQLNRYPNFMDPKPAIAHVLEARRYPDRFALRIVSDASRIVLTAHSLVDGPLATDLERTDARIPWWFEVDIPADTSQAHVDLFVSDALVATQQLALPDARARVSLAH
ncbi:hypothetical protein [Leifsonia sp. NPDC080035]|uniref:Uncharacterized protein n=1 Tax=Leifsonia sp. NPDC080035 TaxID=3143936 RepID=A0AAU7G8B1_9MICO